MTLLLPIGCRELTTDSIVKNQAKVVMRNIFTAMNTKHLT